MDSVPQPQQLLSLAVEPTFLGSLAEHTRTTDDPAFVSLRNRAGSIDGTYRMVNVSGFRVLERTSPAGKQLVIPPGSGLRHLLLQDVHSAGHFGFKRTLQLLQQRVFWPKMAASVHAFVRACEVCAKNKDRTQAPVGLLHPLEVPTARF